MVDLIYETVERREYRNQLDVRGAPETGGDDKDYVNKLFDEIGAVECKPDEVFRMEVFQEMRQNKKRRLQFKERKALSVSCIKASQTQKLDTYYGRFRIRTNFSW